MLRYHFQVSSRVLLEALGGASQVVLARLLRRHVFLGGFLSRVDLVRVSSFVFVLLGGAVQSLRNPRRIVKNITHKRGLRRATRGVLSNTKRIEKKRMEDGTPRLLSTSRTSPGSPWNAWS